MHGSVQFQRGDTEYRADYDYDPGEGHEITRLDVSTEDGWEAVEPTDVELWAFAHGKVQDERDAHTHYLRFPE